MAVLVVDDERRVRSFVERGLTEEGFDVRGCGANGPEAIAIGHEYTHLPARRTRNFDGNACDRQVRLA